jgi:hypothetical protein
MTPYTTPSTPRHRNSRGTRPARAGTLLVLRSSGEQTSTGLRPVDCRVQRRARRHSRNGYEQSHSTRTPWLWRCCHQELGIGRTSSTVRRSDRAPAGHRASTTSLVSGTANRERSRRSISRSAERFRLRLRESGIEGPSALAVSKHQRLPQGSERREPAIGDRDCRWPD